MITNSRINHYLARYPGIPLVIYVGVVLALILVALLALIDIADQYRAVGASREMLARLQRPAPVPASGPGSASAPPGSPFLQGETVTVASAALVERLTRAVARAGGNVVSFEVAPEDAEAKKGYVKVIANCELSQEAIQGLLYDIEAGMPFLFIDQFVAQAPEAANDGVRMRLVLAVSGLWPGAK